MRRSLLTVIILGLLLAACAGASPTTAPTTAIPNPNPPSANSVAVNVEPTIVGTLAVNLTDYIASDPSLVGTTGKPQVVQFFAFWCTVCQGMRPRIHQLQDEYAGAVDFVYLDIDAQNTKDLQKKLTFTGLRPTIVFLDADGNEKSRLVGEQTKEEIQKRIESLVAVGS
jgi:thiol-disulfide isomerase/thioredoxin